MWLRAAGPPGRGFSLAGGAFTPSPAENGVGPLQQDAAYDDVQLPSPTCFPWPDTPHGAVLICRVIRRAVSVLWAMRLTKSGGL